MTDSAWPVRIPLSTEVTTLGFAHLLDRDGVRVFRHRRDEPVRMAAEGWFEHPPAALLEALTDFGSHVGAFDRLAEIRVLERGENHARVYHRLELPVIRDRDFVLDIRWGRDGDLTWLEHRSLAAAEVPCPRRTVRMPHNLGTWQLLAHGDGSRTFARCQASFDMGGHIPRWVTRVGAPSELPGYFACLDALVTRRAARAA